MKKQEFDLAGLKSFLNYISPLSQEYKESFVFTGFETPVIYIGIDCGSTGAISFIYGNLCHVVDIPMQKVELTQKTKKGNRKKRSVPDYDKIIEIFSLIASIKVPVVVGIEKPPVTVITGKVRMTDVFLHGFYSMWPLYLKSLGFEVHSFLPSKWQSFFGLTGKADKETSLELARKKFPKSAFLKRKKDHNRAEAILISLYTQSEFRHD